jgi:aspartate carbamoyltransferase catalytic subunit
MASRGIGVRNLISITDLDRKAVELILKESESMSMLLAEKRSIDPLRNRIMATLFFEPSTRTRLSFESAMQRLGGGVIGFADAATSSATKGESLEDTIKVVSAYADIIVLRHPVKGAVQEAAKYADVPLINAGDGAGHHPTQAIMDLFTIKMEKKRLEGLNVAIVGDLKNARTSHSLAYALAMFGNELTLIAPEQLQMQDEIVNDIKRTYGTKIRKSDSFELALNADVVYIPRVQKERFSNLREYRRFANHYQVNKAFLSRADADVIVMSPLPRINEISREVDATKNAVYFKQAAYGVPVRMAILRMMLGK